MEEHRLTQLTSGGTPFSRGAPLIPRHAGPSASPPTRLLSLPMCAYHSPSRWCGEDWGMALSYSHHPDAFPARPNAPASPGTPSAPSHRAHRRLWLHLIAAASTASLGIAGNEDAACWRADGAGRGRPTPRVMWAGREPGAGVVLDARRCRIAHPPRAIGPRESCALLCVRTRVRSCARPKECGVALSQLFSRGVAPQLCAVRVFLLHRARAY